MTDSTTLPRLSVIIPAYNAANSILRALDSVRAQDMMAELEVVIADDGSQDGTAELVRAQRRPGERITILTLPGQGGASRARNAAIAAARGDYIAFLDADDQWLPGKLARQMAILDAEPETTLVGSDSERVNADTGEPMMRMHQNHAPQEGTEAWQRLLHINFLPTSTVVTRRALLLELGGFDLSMVVGEDLDLWIRLAMRGAVRVVPEPLSRYHDHAGSLMKRHF
ncbi:MAG: glycosyltransferase, partial [Magnetococcales bacterium]|nr:glycosyltransferase [Magnetococcales bacterium]